MDMEFDLLWAADANIAVPQIPRIGDVIGKQWLRSYGAPTEIIGFFDEDLRFQITEVITRAEIMEPIRMTVKAVEISARQAAAREMQGVWEAVSG